MFNYTMFKTAGWYKMKDLVLILLSEVYFWGNTFFIQDKPWTEIASAAPDTG